MRRSSEYFDFPHGSFVHHEIRPIYFDFTLLRFTNTFCVKMYWCSDEYVNLVNVEIRVLDAKTHFPPRERIPIFGLVVIHSGDVQAKIQ